MKAVCAHGRGDVGKLRLEEVECPQVMSPTEARVKVRVAGLRHIDIWNRRGRTGLRAKTTQLFAANYSLAMKVRIREKH